MMMTLALAFLTSEIDLNERRRLEAALRKSSRFIGTILGSASDVAIIAAEKDLLITVFNTGAERLLGYTAEEVIGKVTPAIFADPAGSDRSQPRIDGAVWPSDQGAGHHRRRRDHR